MTLPRLLKIDPSNRGDHYYLEEEHECFYFHEYFAGKGFLHSAGNQFISNLKKSVLTRGQPQYQYKEQAITRAARMLGAVFVGTPAVFTHATITAIPPSKLRDHAEYDDRINRIIAGACHGHAADVRDLVLQTQGYDASHNQASGGRKKPHELEAIYALSPQPPRSTVILVDDVLTTGAHFVAARNVIRTQYPDTKVYGFFLARRVVPNILDDFQSQP